MGSISDKVEISEDESQLKRFSRLPFKCQQSVVGEDIDLEDSWNVLLPSVRHQQDMLRDDRRSQK
jgi:hypothetical protein